MATALFHGVRPLFATLVVLLTTTWASELRAQVVARALEQDGFDEIHQTALPQAEEAEEEAAEAGEAPGASVGEGGRDLAARFSYPLGHELAVGVEMHAAAGDDPALLGFGARQLRWQPLWMLRYAARHDVEVFAGAGVGAAHVMPNEPREVPPLPGTPVASDNTYSVATQVGMRLTRFEMPFVALLRTDDLASQGFAVRMIAALELAP